MTGVREGGPDKTASAHIATHPCKSPPCMRRHHPPMMRSRLIATSATPPPASRTATLACALARLDAGPMIVPESPRTVSMTLAPAGNRAAISSGAPGKQWREAWCASSAGVANVMKQCRHRVLATAVVAVVVVARSRVAIGS